MNIVIENTIRYCILFLIQVLLINNLYLYGVCNPCIYVLCLLALPVTLPRWVELLIGFATGLLFDMFSNSLGVHTAACVAVAYVRPLLIKRLIADNERLIGTPSSALFGMATYVRYIALLVCLHHTILFVLEAFSLHNWWLILLQIVCSSIISIAVFLGIDYFKA